MPVSATTKSVKMAFASVEFVIMSSSQAGKMKPLYQDLILSFALAEIYTILSPGLYVIPI